MSTAPDTSGHLLCRLELLVDLDYILEPLVVLVDNPDPLLALCYYDCVLVVIW